MKVRNGFVSNSSSSSFLLYGICLPESEMLAALTNNNTEYDDDDLSDILYGMFDETDMDYVVTDDGVCLGASFVTSLMDDDPTDILTKENTRKRLTELLGEGLKFGVFSGTEYN